MQQRIEIIPIKHARRLFLNAQGLFLNPTCRPGPATVRKIVEQLGFVQIDSVNIVQRAHHLTLHTRLDGYQPDMLDRLIERKPRRLFEHWTHDASAIPVELFSYWKPIFAQHDDKIRSHQWWIKRMGGEPDAVIGHVLERIEREGALRSRDFEHDRRDGEQGWWGWKPQKAALEYLWYTGQLMIAHRENFQKVYDLASRVIPDEWYRAQTPSEEERIDWACRFAIERLGVATVGEITGFWRFFPATTVRAWCDRAVDEGSLVPMSIRFNDGTVSKPTYYALCDWKKRVRAAQRRALPDRVRLLCPFDPLIRDRKRTLRWFGFDYKYEGFVPAKQRKFGYYVMPVLEGDRFIGRMDPKFHRDRGVLRINGVWWEDGVRVTKKRLARFEEAVERLAEFIGAEVVEFG